MNRLLAATILTAITFTALPKPASAGDLEEIKVVGKPQKVPKLAGLTIDAKPALAIICVDGYKYLVLAGPNGAMEQSMAITQMFEEKKSGNTVASVPSKCSTN